MLMGNRMKKWTGCCLLMLFTVCLCQGCGGVRETAATAGTISENAVDTVSENSVSGNASGGIGLDSSDPDSQTVSGNGTEDATVSGNGTGDASVSENTLDIGTRPDPVKVKGIYVSGPVAGIARMDELISLVDQTELNALVIDIKNDEGRVTYKMQSEQVLEIGSGIRYIPDIKELVAKCKEKNIYLIARIVAFRDPYLAEKKPEWAVHTADGGIFRDKNGMAWVNPYCRGVWDYLVEIASQAALEGFDEVQFDYIRFSTDIGEENIDYGPESEGVDKIQIITEFTQYLYEKLAPQGVYVAADVFGTVIDNATDQVIVDRTMQRWRSIWIIYVLWSILRTITTAHTGSVCRMRSLTAPSMRRQTLPCRRSLRCRRMAGRRSGCGCRALPQAGCPVISATDRSRYANRYRARTMRDMTNGSCGMHRSVISRMRF